jgi:hypothetical protein
MTTRRHPWYAGNTLPAVLNLLAAGILFGMILAFGIVRLAEGLPFIYWYEIFIVCSGVCSLVVGLRQLSQRP